MRLKTSLVALPVLFGLVLTTSPATAATCGLADLQLLAGIWRDTDEPNVLTEERWVIGPGGRMIGSSWRLHTDSDGGVLESMMIVMENGKPTMRIRHFDATLANAREEKDAPMIFVASKCEDNSVVLDGTGPQAGEHFTYTRNGDTLKFVGDFIHDGKPVRAEAFFDRQT